MKNNFFINLPEIKNLLGTDPKKIPFHQLPEALTFYGKKIRREIKSLTSYPSDFELIEKLEKIFIDFDRCLQFCSALTNLHESTTLSQVVQKGENLKIKLASELTSNAQIFKKLNSISLTHLGEIEQNLVRSWIKSFLENGANLPPAKQQKLMKIDQKLNKLEILHNKIITQETYNKTFKIKFKDCNGIPQTVLSDAKKTSSGYLFNDTHTGEILTFAHNPQVRKKAYEITKSIGKNPRVNKLLVQVNHLRQEKAKILGFSSYLNLSLDQKMAKNTVTLNKVLKPLFNKVFPQAQKHYKLLEKSNLLSTPKLNPWDNEFVNNLVLKKKHKIDVESLKLNFPRQKVIKGLLKYLQKWMNLDFKKIKAHLPTYKVFYQKEFVGYVSLDLYLRPKKTTGAWMDNFVSGGFETKPWVLLACNFNPSDHYLSLEDLTTLFHEMGHVIHGLINNSPYPSLNGTNVVEDFVEFPSQFMENLILTKPVLKLISKKSLDYKTINQLVKFQRFGASAWILKQYYYLMLDYHFHSRKLKNYQDVVSLEQRLYQKIFKTNLAQDFTEINSFGHLTDNNYGAAYYSYLWASLLEKDAFIHLQGHGFKWPDLEPCFRTMGKNEMKVFNEFKGSISIKNFLKAFGLD